MKLSELVDRRQRFLDTQRENKFDFTAFLADTYADEFHYLYELVQNAEDAGATRLELELTNDCFRSRHNGRVFSVQDVDAVTGISNLDNHKKQQDSGAIGRFGIGFKSVFNITERPRIRSGQFDFSIEYLILPVIHSETENFADTLLELPLKPLLQASPGWVARLHSRLAGFEAHNLLFLRSLSEIHVAWGEGRTRTLRKTSVPVAAAPDLVADVCISADESEFQYLLFGASVAHPDFSHLSHRLMLAFSRGPEGRLVRAERSQVFVFFRTNHESYLKFLVHAPFLPTPDRGDIKEVPLNAALAAELGSLLRVVLRHFRQQNMLTVELLALLPVEPEDKAQNQWVYRHLFAAARTELASPEAYLPTNRPNRLAAADHVLLARSTELTALLANKEQLRALDNNRTHWISADLSEAKHPALYKYLKEELKVPEISAEDGVRRLLQAGLLNNATAEWMGRFYAFLQNLGALWRVGSRYEKAGFLRTEPIIRLAGTPARHVAPFDAQQQPQAFLPVEGPGAALWNERCVAPDVLANERAKTFLVSLGLKQPDVFDEIERRILPTYAGPTPPGPELHRQHMAQLVQVYTQGTEDQKLKLRNLLQKDWPKFIRAIPANIAGKATYMALPNVYLPTAELRNFFSIGQAAVYYVDEDFYNAGNHGPWRGLLDGCGIKTDRPQVWSISDFNALSSEKRDKLRVQKQGNNAYSNEINLIDYRIDGLEDFLLKGVPLIEEKSKLLWGVLGKISSINWSNGKYRWKYYSEYEATFDSSVRKLLETTPWLLGPAGVDGTRRWQTVPETVFADLPAEYEQASEGARRLATTLRWKPSNWVQVEQLLTPEQRQDLDYAKRMRELGIDVGEELRKHELAQQTKLRAEELRVEQAPEIGTQQLEIRPFQPYLAGSVGAGSRVAGGSISSESTTGVQGAYTPPSAEMRQRIGQRGEALVWAELGREWAAKEDFHLEEETETRRRYLDSGSVRYEIEWGNDAQRTSTGCDFVVRRCLPNETVFHDVHYHEVKASEDVSKTWFDISELQWQLARQLHEQQNGKSFELWLVRGVFLPHATVIRIANPVGEWQAGRLRANPVRVEL
ncbi:sacsin N-terminal ATP-binding-like domain-containing protein [Hymenobacter ruricola]|uniref:Sacsin/Nov domain-containing protein n=1 Tax=Hymenobacter ruricola TaxID=2791023 RepID=A0ABS0I628_9BACT|nr:hypothetical protein [Hymenobacter ruricola]MBF9222413.1 hypothetical protein [Hymenobacter ruricola]